MLQERDTRKTDSRASIQALYARRGIVPSSADFNCRSLHRCSESGRVNLRKGNWAYVGADYGDARIEGHAAKILFVAMDRGGAWGSDDEPFEETQRSFRATTEVPPNPHMRGLVLTMRALTDERSQRAFAGQYALTNAVKCIRSTKSQATNASTTMISQCASHLRAEIDELAPDVLITQGTHPTATVRGLHSGMELIKEFHGATGRQTGVWRTPNRIVLTMPHPARQPGLKWTTGEIPDFWADAISLTREKVASELSSRG